LKSHQAATLIEAFTLFSGLMHALRIAKDGSFSTQEASPGLQNLLVRAGGERRMHDLETRLSTTRQKVRALLEEIAGPLQAGSSTTESGANER
jgi:hypothetical protein